MTNEREQLKDESKAASKFNVRVDATLTGILQQLIQKRKAESLSEYIRGLILLDALEVLDHNDVLPGVVIPKWLHERLVFSVKKKGIGA